MVDVLKMTYKELYYFKKVLKETGQKLLAKQVTAPVMWEDSVASVLSKGFEKAMELGPGKVTAGVLKRIDKTAACENVEV